MPSGKPGADVAGGLGRDPEVGGPPILRIPTPTELAALAYLTIAVTALVFIAWYGAIERLGVDRTGLFNGLIPVTPLAAVALTGTGTITPGPAPRSPRSRVSACGQQRYVAGPLLSRLGNYYFPFLVFLVFLVFLAMWITPLPDPGRSTKC